MSNSPTIVAASLDDKEMKQSIANLVASVKRATQTMVTDFDNAVNHMNAKMKDIGTGKTATGASSASETATQRDTQAVEENTTARKKNVQTAKEQELTFDQLASAMRYAMGKINEFNTRRETMLPDRKEYLEYERNIQRVAELQGKLKDSAISRALQNEQTYTFDAKRVIADVTNVDMRYKQLTQSLKELENQSKKDYSSRIKEAIKLPTENIEQVREKMQRLISLLREGVKTEFITVEQDRMLKESVSTLFKVRNANMENAQAAAQYTEEIRRQAQAIRESQQFQEKGFYSVNFNEGGKDVSRYVDAKNTLSVEEQLVNIYKEHENAISRTAKEAEAERRAREQEEGVIKHIVSDEETLQMRNEQKINQIKDYEDRIDKLTDKQSKLLNAKPQNNDDGALDKWVEKYKRVTDAIAELTAKKEKLAAQDTSSVERGGNTQALSEEASKVESFTETIARLLKVQESQVVLANEETASYDKLSTSLKQLGQAYNKMSAEERNSENGKTIIASMHEVERAIAKIRAQASRPINLESIIGVNGKGGLSEKTLDDIAYKMKQLASYRSGLDVNAQKNEIWQVNQEYDRLKKKMDEVMQKNNEVIKSNTALGRSWNYMKNRLAFYFTVGTTTQFVKSLVDVRGQYELLERSIGILIDSAQNGSRIFAELNSMAIKSPFTTMELGAAAKQLTAYDVAAKDVVDTTRRLADMAAAVGVPIERLTYALGQIKSYDYLNARDARMFANTGIPLVKELADMYTKLEGRLVSTADVYDRIKKKMISYEDVMKVVNEMTDEGGKFFNFQEKAADTLKVKIANLTLAWNNMLNEIGKDQNGFIRGGLNALKEIMERWRDIYNFLLSYVVTLGVAKAIEIAILLYQQKITTYMEAQALLGTRMANILRSAKGLMMNLISPAGAISAALTIVAVVLQKLFLDYYDLQKANDAFNKSIADGAEENIKSIDKFFNDYKKELDTIASAGASDQQKMWEKIQEEIEKTIKNAEDYLDVLNRIEDASDRIKAGKAILEQQKQIEQAAKDLANKGVFDIGGGFADDDLAKDLKDYQDYLESIIRLYDSVEHAEQVWGKSTYANPLIEYKDSLKEADKELDKFVSKLERADLDRIMGSGSVEQKFANIRNFVTIIRDAFLATEQGSKLTVNGQSKLNAKLDEWITKQGVANNLIKERTIDGKTYTSAEIANIESQRSAWEKFFSRLSSDQRKTLDYAIKTNQTASDEVKEIWDAAAKTMKDNESSAYDTIQEHIETLRNSPDIVLNVIYRESTGKSTDKQIEQFEKDFIEPVGKGVLSVDEYFAAVEENTKKYGRFIKKEGEDNVEWEKRLGQEYQDNVKSIESLNNMLKNSANMSEADTQAKRDERDSLVEYNKALDEIAKKQGFNYEQFKKGGKSKDVLGEALTKEVQLITDIRKRYDEYKKVGVDTQKSIALATDEYGVSLKNVKNTLASFGIKGLEGVDVANMQMRDLVKRFEEMKTLASAMGNTKGVEALEKAIASLNVDITKLDYKKVTEGLNNELSKINEQYELAVELQANADLGNQLIDLFGLDTSQFPQNIDDYVSSYQSAIWDAIAKRHPDVDLSGFDILDVDFKKLFKDIDVDSEFMKKLLDAQKQVKQKTKEWTTDIYNQIKQLEYDLGDTEKKIAIKEGEIEKLRLRYREAANEKDRQLIDLQIQNTQRELDELKEGILQLMPSYAALFGSVAKHSDALTMRIAKRLKKAYEDAKKKGKNSKGEYTFTDPKSGEQTTLNERQLGNEINKVNKKMQESQPLFKRLIEDFTKGEDKEIDFAQGMLDISEALGQVKEGIDLAGNIAESLGADDETKGMLEDIGQMIEGIGTAAQGIGQIASGDVIGGAVKVIGGLFEAIGSLFNGSNRRITRQVEESEKQVKQLELSYKRLSYQIEKTLGDSETFWRRTAIANKEAELQELQHQLVLEESRKKKNQDEDKMNSLRSSIIDIQQEIQNLKEEVVSTLTGSDIKTAAEAFVDTWVDAWKAGETTLDAIDEKMDEVIQNIIKKAMTNKIVASLLQPFYDTVDYMTTKNSEGGEALTINEMKQLAEKAGILSSDINDALGAFYGNLAQLGIISQTEDANKELSALQQGIQSITEDTAGALEAYANSISQQVYLHSQLLTEIRDAVISMTGGDLQMGVQAQMLFEMQQSVIVQRSIEGILNGVLNPSGRAFTVELIS